MIRKLGLLLIPMMTICGCVSQQVHLSALDGRTMRGTGPEDSTTLWATFCSDSGGAKTEHRRWLEVSVRIPDERVDVLPLQLDEVEARCVEYTASTRRELPTGESRVTVFAGGYGALEAEIEVDCNGEPVRVRGLYDVKGTTRSGIWPYLSKEPDPSLVQRIGKLARYAWWGYS